MDLDESPEVVVEPTFLELCLRFKIRATCFTSLYGRPRLHEVLLGLWREYGAPALTA